MDSNQPTNRRLRRVPIGYESAPDPMLCPRCQVELQFIGTKKFHEGGSQGTHVLLGGWSELFTNREQYDVYVCPRCGRVEMFVDGIGDEFRPH